MPESRLNHSPENSLNHPPESILNLPTDKLTPGMKQYQEAKRANPDCLILLRMGDFYETFYEDAVTAARELEITLTSRGKGDKKAPLAGIPYHALEPYLARLIKKGHKVAIIEQLEDPKLAKGLVKRGLLRIVTPGTVIESSMLDEKENNFIMAVTSFREEFALAFCDLSTGEFFTTKIETLPQLMTEIVRLNPSECLVPESLMVNAELISKIKAHCFVNSFDDYYFKTAQAKEILLKHFNINSLDVFGLEDNSGRLEKGSEEKGSEDKKISVSGALLKYLLDTQKNSLSHIRKISIKSNLSKMLLDSSTLRNLELSKNIKDSSARGTLLSVLDKTVTAMGARLLKKWIKEPLLKKEVINKRLEAIEALNKNVIVREEIISLLNDVFDLERLISRANYGNASPRDLLALKRTLQQIPLIKEKLSFYTKYKDETKDEINREESINYKNDIDSKNELLSEIADVPGFEEVFELIHKAIKDDAPLLVREGNIIRKNYNEELDKLRDIKTNSKKYLQELEEKERQKTGITTLKIGYTKVFGYFIEITKRNVHLVPGNYIRKQTTANSERYITEELKLEEEKILGAEERINGLEYELFQDLIKKVAEHTEKIQGAASKLAVLDVLCSLAKVAMENNYVKPQFVDEKVIQIKNGRHPVIEKIESNFIPNDVMLSENEMMIITGANMSGKSTIMRQTALIVLMAQMGCFVPADEAVLGITDRIFTRVGAYDDLSSGQSTFMVEMTETASIINNATEDSLIILDEIGRGTSTFDGVSIAWSVAEYIHNNIKAKSLFSTHYHVMNKLAEKFKKIKNYYLTAKEVKGEIIFLYKLVEGGTDQSYGIHVAKLAGLPVEVVARAAEIQKILETDDDMMRKIKARKLEEQMSLEGF